MALTLLAGSSPTLTAVTAEKFSALSIQASAASEGIENGFTYISYSNDSYAEITGYQGASNDVVIPDSVNGIPVTRIGKDAFADTSYSRLQSITVPDSVTYIGANAFKGCTGVKTGTIPTKFIAICAAAREIVVPESVNELITFTIVDNEKTTVTIPDGLASIYDYTIDGITLSDKGVAVPAEVTQADISGLSKSQLESFLAKYNTIQKVEIRNKECIIPEGSIPATYVTEIDGETNSVTVRGYFYSTAEKFTEDNDVYIFEPIDTLNVEDYVKLNLSSELTGSTQFNFVVNAEVEKYQVARTGLIVEKYGAVTSEEQARTELVLKGAGITGTSKEGETTYATPLTDSGDGIWAVPYVTVNTSEGEVTVYGDPEYFFSEELVKSKLDIALTATPSKVNAGKFIFQADSNNNKYTLKETGLIVNSNGQVSLKDADEKLVLGNGFTTVKKTANTYKGNLMDKGQGIWARGYVTVIVNNIEVTKYTDPVYVRTETDAEIKEKINVNFEAAQVENTDGKFKFDTSVTFDGLDGYEILACGVVADRNAQVTAGTVNTLLTIDTFAFSGVDNTDSFFTATMEDRGRGIWARGFVTVRVNGKEVTKYSEPKYMFSEEIVKSRIGVNIGTKPSRTTDKTFIFNVDSNPDIYEIKATGILVDRKNRVTAETAKNPGNLVLGGFASENNRNATNAYLGNLSDLGQGIWAVGYVIVDVNGTEVVKYTDAVYVSSEDVISNIDVGMTATVNAETGKVVFRVNSDAGKYTLKKTGVIVESNNRVNGQTAASELVLEKSKPIVSDGYTVAGNATTSYVGNLKDKGYGVWGVGFVTVADANGKEYTKYTAPIFEGTEEGIKSRISLDAVANASSTKPGYVNLHVTAALDEGLSNYKVKSCGVILNRKGEINSMEEAASDLILGNGYTTTGGTNTELYYDGHIQDLGTGVWAVGYITIENPDGVTITKYTAPVFKKLD